MHHRNDPERQPTPMIKPTSIQTKVLVAVDLETLERRIDDGYARIESARSRGQDVTAWEEFWIELLHQYELAVNEFPEAA